MAIKSFDRLLQQQLPPESLLKGLVVRNTFIDFEKPLITGARVRARSEGAKPIDHGFKDEAICHTPDIWGDEDQPMQIVSPMSFTVDDIVANLTNGYHALRDFGLELCVPGFAAHEYQVHDTIIDFQGPGAKPHSEGGNRTPSLWGDDDQLVEKTASGNLPYFNIGCDASFLRVFDQSDLAPIGSSPWEESALEGEVRQMTCDGTCTGCYWHAKNKSCHWGDKCKFCHRCQWGRLTRAVQF